MKKKIKSKFLGAAFLGLLAISGGVLAAPLLSADNQPAKQKTLGVFAQNPERFLQTENLGLKAGFQSSRDNFVEEFNSIAVNEGALESAIRGRNYEAWKEALQNINGFSENGSVIDKEDFNVLAALNKTQASEENGNSE